MEKTHMSDARLTVAMLTEVFHDDPGGERLLTRLEEARTAGAELAVLPELPLNSWCPASRNTADADAEPPGGARQQIMSQTARRAGIGLLGGAIVRDPETGTRHNTAILYDLSGQQLATYRKLHLPQEEGFWEASHYQAGSEPPGPIAGFAMPIGVQVCSDVNRPEGTLLLGTQGTGAVFVPRATPPESYARWRVVLQANAVTAAVYVVSVNRTDSDSVVPIGGPSVAIAPDGEVMVETTDPVACVTLSGKAVEAARREYPGYLPVRADLYARAWAGIARE